MTQEQRPINMVAMTYTAWIRLGLLVMLSTPLLGCALFQAEEAATSPGKSVALQGDPLPYRIRITTTAGGRTVVAGDETPDEVSDQAVPAEEEGATSGSDGITRSEARKLVAGMSAGSQMVQLQSEPPDSRIGLERRIRADLETAVKFLHSQGYYAGKARYTADWNATPVSVELILEPGPLYVIGTTSVSYRREASTPQIDPPEGAPRTLADVGLPDGAPAVADAVKAAVGRLPDRLQTRGYPYAAVEKTRYVADHRARTLDAQVAVVTGVYAKMDGVIFSGADNVGRVYLERLVPWKQGTPWNAERLAQYRDALQQTGLFRVITVEPAKELNERGELPVAVALTEASPRTVSAGAKYASDVGFGVQGAWEHRNFFGNGERLRLTMPIAQDRQEFNASLVKPAFGRSDQNLLIDAAVRNEETDAYDQTAVYGAIGLERRLSSRWWASARVAGESGTLDEGEGRQSYFLVGLPLSIRRDGSDNLFNPTRGTRLEVTGTPYIGSWHKAFSTFRIRVDGSAYYSPSGTDSLVFAVKAAAGSMTGSDLHEIPGSIRFYAGGGGSVRGYKYQSLGRHDADGDPEGGLSFNEVSLEARFKVSEHIGLVPFVDGGMVYEESTPRWGEDMAWAVGLGLRYFTAIGPVRVDFAVPLDDRDRQDDFQFYISIGQAF